MGICFGMSLKRKPTPEFLNFLERTPGSEDWFPLHVQTMQGYIGSVNHKLAFNPWLEKWIGQARPAWEEQFGKDANLVKVINNFTNRYLGPQAVMPFGQIADKLVNFEYTHQLAGNIGTAVLHMFKGVKSIAAHLTSPMAVMDLTKGVYGTTKALRQMISGSEGVERSLVNNLMNSKELMRAITQDAALEQMLKPGTFRKVSKRNRSSFKVSYSGY